MGFASGFTAGLFGSVDRALQEEFRTAKAETARLTSLRQARTAQRNDAREAKVEKANEEIQALAGKIGPGSGIILNDFIQEGGLSYAKEATTKLLDYTQKTGITPVQFYKLTEAELGKKPNAQFFNTLAQSAVPAVKPLGEPVTTAGGIAKYFGYGGPEVVKKKTEAGLSSTGGRSIRDISGLTEVRDGITDTAIPIQYSIKDEQIFNAKEALRLTDLINTPETPKEKKKEYQLKLQTVNEKIEANRKIQKYISPDKDPESQYFRLVNEGRTAEAEQLLQVIIRFNTETTPSTKTYGNSGTMTKAMVMGLPAFVAKKVGFDPLNPSRPVKRRVFDKVTGKYITDEIPGEQAEKEYNMGLYKGYVNYANNLAVKSDDADSVSMQKLLNEEIRELRVTLGIDTSNTTTTTTPATATGTGTGTNTGTAPKKRSVVLNKNTFVKTLRKIENDPSIPTDEKESTVIQIFSASGYSNEEIKKVVEEIKKEQASGLDPSFTKNKLTDEEIKKTMGDGPRRDKQGLVPRRERFSALLEGRRNPLGGTEYDKMGPQT